MTLRAHSPRNLSSDEERSIESFSNTRVHAIAAIGNPRRFYQYLEQSGLTVIEHDFPDHYRYGEQDICFDDDHRVFMTEKDAVKCRKIAQGDRYWVIPIDAVLDERLSSSLLIALPKKLTPNTL